MPDEQAAYEEIADIMRTYGYAHVTAAMVRDIDQAGSSGTEHPQGVVTMFATKQIEEAREIGLLPPKT